MSTPTADNPWLELRVEALRRAARGVLQIELVHPQGQALPAFTAGAHIDVRVPGGRTRSYSLANAPSERHRYVLGVKVENPGRGGSRWLHEHLRVDSLLAVSAPINHFELDDGRAPAVLFAGGIGVTPIASMAAHLRAIGRDFVLHYAVRERVDAAFLVRWGDIALDTGDGRLQLHVDVERGGRVLDIAALVKAAPADAHFYCCGPAPMLAAFEAATAERPPANRHLERFTSDVAPAADGGFEVVLARAQRSVAVAKGQTILDALRQAGVTVIASCEQGVCGTCETRVIEGVPDHRDMLLSEAERARNDVMMICCSGSTSARLVLDL